MWTYFGYPKMKQTLKGTADGQPLDNYPIFALQFDGVAY